MFWVIKRIPYTPLVTLICSLFSFQACIKSRFDLGFLNWTSFFPFILFLLLLCRLYVSPKKQVADPGPESPLKWCRQALDHRSPETEMACRTLISRLDQSKASTNRWVGKKKKKKKALCTMKALASNQAPDWAKGQRRAICAPAVFLFTAHVSFCVTRQTPFIINCAGTPVVGRRTSTTASLTPALNDNRK